MPDHPPWLGGAAAMMAVVITHPIDQTKIRAQTQLVRLGMLSTVKNTLQSGVLELWTGLSGSLLRQATYGAARFGIYAELNKGGDSSRLMLVRNGAIAGGGSGDRGRTRGDGVKPPSQRFNYRNALDGVYRIAKDDGVRHVFRGTGVTCLRSVIMNASQLSCASCSLSQTASPAHAHGVSRWDDRRDVVCPGGRGKVPGSTIPHIVRLGDHPQVNTGGGSPGAIPWMATCLAEDDPDDDAYVCILRTAEAGVLGSVSPPALPASSRCRLRSVLMRAGTSKGLFLRLEDLPEDRAAWTPLILAAMGSPDANSRQLDGMGGGQSTTSKVAVVSRSTSPDADVDYLFIQGSNWSSASPADSRSRVNTNRIIRSTFATHDGVPVELGDMRLDGVSVAGAPVRLDFLDPAGSMTGRLLPTGRPMDAIVVGTQTYHVSCVDAANPFVFVSADELGVDGDSSLATLTPTLMSIRAIAAVQMGLAESVETASLVMGTPKIAIVGPPTAYTTSSGRRVEPTEQDIWIRAYSMGRPHPAVQMTGAVCIGAASAIPGTLVHRYFVESRTHRGESTSGPVVIGHAGGTMAVEGSCRQTLEGEVIVDCGTVYRTARRLMEGTLGTEQVGLAEAQKAGLPVLLQAQGSTLACEVSESLASPAHPRPTHGRIEELEGEITQLQARIRELESREQGELRELDVRHRPVERDASPTSPAPPWYPRQAAHGPTSALYDDMDEPFHDHATVPEAELRDKATARCAEERHMEVLNLASGLLDFDGVPPDLAMHLLALHWNRQHFAFLISYRPLFTRDMACQGPYFSKLLLNAIFFSVSKFSERPEVYDDPLDQTTAGRRFVRRIKELLGAALDQSSIPTIQAMLLLSSSFFALGHQSAAWLYSGIALRMIFDLVSDKIISLYQGRGVSFESRRMHVPHRFLDRYEEQELWTPFAFPGIHRYPGAPARAISTFTSLCSLSVIMDRVITDIYADKGPNDRPGDHLDRLSNMLERWKVELPVEIAFDPASDQAVPPPHVLSLHSVYYTLVTLLHRPFVEVSHQVDPADARPAYRLISSMSAGNGASWQPKEPPMSSLATDRHSLWPGLLISSPLAQQRGGGSDGDHKDTSGVVPDYQPFSESPMDYLYGFLGLPMQ
ncbi:hypothetical protein IAU60_001922 [Kwoniella sp. DSM 27419]